MSWCDKLASVPAVGLGFDATYFPSSKLLEACRPLIDKLVGSKKPLIRPKLTLTKQEAFAIEMATEDGFTYGFDPSKIFVDFKYRLKARNVSMGQPVAELTSQPRAFTDLLPEMCERLVEASRPIMALEQRHLYRVGVITTTNVKEDDAPPGLLEFIRYFNRPWKGEVSSYNFTNVAVLEDSALSSDQCVHSIVRAEQSEGMITMIFDWHRSFKDPKVVGEESLSMALADARRDALAYFEVLGEGVKFHEIVDAQTQ